MSKWETKGEDHPVTTVLLEAGEKVALYRCAASRQFPFCDGSHKEHPGRGPVIVEAEKQKEA